MGVGPVLVEKIVVGAESSMIFIESIKGGPVYFHFVVFRLFHTIRRTQVWQESRIPLCKNWLSQNSGKIHLHQTLDQMPVTLDVCFRNPEFGKAYCCYNKRGSLLFAQAMNTPQKARASLRKNRRTE